MQASEAKAAWEENARSLEIVAWLAVADRWHGQCQETAAQLVADAIGYGWQRWAQWAPRRDAGADSAGTMRHCVRLGVRRAIVVYTRQQRGGIPVGELFDAVAPEQDWSIVDRWIESLSVAHQAVATLLANGLSQREVQRVAKCDISAAVASLRRSSAMQAMAVEYAVGNALDCV